MKKIIAIFALALAVLAFAPQAHAQKGKVYRVGYLTPATTKRADRRSHMAAFRRGLKELGYVQGKNLLLEERWAEGKKKRLPALTKELARFKPDVIAVHHNAAIKALKANRVTRKIPMVFIGHGDPVGAGVVASFARPGGNITGVSNYQVNLVPKRLEILREVDPSISRVAVLWTPGSKPQQGQFKAIHDAAPKMGVKLLSLGMSEPEDIDRVLAAMEKERPGGLIVFGGPNTGKNRKRIFKFAIKNRLPAIFTHGGWVAGGGLMSYGANFERIWHRAAYYVDRILKGTNPADLPVEVSRKFDLIINLKTAKAMGITIPPEVLFRATKVIK